MEKEMSANESLEIITRAIAQVKKNAGGKEGSFQLLWWGWIIALANLAHYLLAINHYEHPYIVWVVTVPAAIVSAVQGYRSGKKRKIRTHMDDVYGQIWMATFVVIITLVLFMARLDYNHNPAILCAAAIGMYVTGVLLRFKPIVIGAIVLWMGAIVAFNVGVNEQYLVASVAIMLGYLVPGYLLKREEK